MKKVLVLGGGMVGSVMAADLSKSYEVTVYDLNLERIENLADRYVIKSEVKDLSILSGEASFVNDLQNFDLIIGAVPGFMGFEVMKAVLNSGKPIVDISFFPEDPFLLTDIAKSNNTFGIMDIGVAPGMGNLILGYHSQTINVSNFECYVAGLPLERKMPFQYKAPFSPIDVLEEYTRPARLKINGKIVTKPALSELENIDFPEIGTLQAFNTDGLRSLLYTFPNVPNMKEKTMRYPGHIDMIESMKKIGLLSEEEVDLKGIKIRPIDLTAKLLFDEWKLEDGDDEFTVMKVIVEGTDKATNEAKRFTYYLHDLYDFTTRFSSMSRTTGYTATAVADYILSNNLEISDKYRGVFPPELIAESDLFNYVMHYLHLRGVEYYMEEELIEY